MPAPRCARLSVRRAATRHPSRSCHHTVAPAIGLQRNAREVVTSDTRKGQGSGTSQILPQQSDDLRPTRCVRLNISETAGNGAMYFVQWPKLRDHDSRKTAAPLATTVLAFEPASQAWQVQTSRLHRPNNFCAHKNTDRIAANDCITTDIGSMCTNLQKCAQSRS